MTSSGTGGGPYEVRNSAAITQEFRQLLQKAVEEGRGEEFLRAARQLSQLLRQDPSECGEPLYRLPILRMQVRCVAIRPPYADFAVCEDMPLVFIKAVRLLAKSDA
jgi:hypothetical protein